MDDLMLLVLDLESVLAVTLLLSLMIVGHLTCLTSGSDEALPVWVQYVASREA